MLQKLNKNKGGFTLVEIMIVVAIIALLAAIAVPNFLRARKRSQATRILEDLRQVDAAIGQFAIDSNKDKNYEVKWDDLRPYFKPGSVLATASPEGKDLFGHTYLREGQTVNMPPQVDDATVAEFEGIVDADFWKGYEADLVVADPSATATP